MSTLKAVTNSNLTATTLSEDTQGKVVIDKSSTLTRLNYFDGKFLRAPDLQLEQAALLSQMRLASQAAGGGVIHGFNCVLSGGDNISISAGLAYDWQGRALVLSQTIEVPIGELIANSKTATSSGQNKAGSGIVNSEFTDCEIQTQDINEGDILSTDETYLIVLSHIEAYCGEEDVYGKLCSEACISSTQRTHIVEGIQITAIPLNLTEALKLSTAVALSQKHLRSRISSAFFAQEQGSIASLITEQGLNANTWCLGAESLTGQGLPIALVSRSGATTVFLDAWSVRRERMETPPQLYWAARMGMRSGRVFLAQMLQFQCQLKECLGNFDPEQPPLATDPCVDEKQLLQTAATDMQQLLSYYTDVSAKLVEVSTLPLASVASLDVAALQSSINRLQAATSVVVSQQLLIDCGIVELPSAGYLPVVAESSLTINEQVRNLLGTGVDLRFCSVRPDYVHHAIEEAQHMQRICLLSGLDDAGNMQDVDILVPDGVINQTQTEISPEGYQAHLDSSDTMVGMMLHLVGSTFNGKLETQSGRNDLVIATTNPAATKFAGDAITEFAVDAATELSALTAERKVASTFSSRASAININTNTATASRVQQINLKDVRVSEGSLDFGETMTGSARAEVANDIKAFYLATENAVSMTVDGQSIDADINFWAQMQTEQDPFTLAAGGRTNITSRLLMKVGLDYPLSDSQLQIELVIDLNISGQVIVETIAQTGNNTELSGRFIGDCILQYTTILNGESEVQVDAASLSDTINMSRTITEHGPEVSIVIPSPALFGDQDIYNMVYEQRYNAAGEIEVLAYIDAKTDKGEERQNFLSGKFVDDASALTPGSSFYNQSILAINNIASALNNSGFAEVASNLLFPPPVVIADDLRVTGTYPWVLFHRRRDKTCEQSEPAAAVAPARHYEIYNVTLNTDISADELLATIDKELDSLVVDAVAVAVADYAANSQVLTSAHQNLQTTWTNSVGNSVSAVVGVIASRGDVLSEGTTLASARLLSLGNVLSAVADIDSTLPLVARETVPEGLGVGDVDGVIIYFTRIADVVTQTDCHAVYQVVSTDPDEIERQLKEAIAQFNAGVADVTIDGVFNNDNAGRLPVTPSFVAGSADFTSADDVEKLNAVWQEMGGMLVTHAGALYAEENDTIATITSQQSEAIAQTVGALASDSGENRGSFVIPQGMLDTCQRATILLTASQCHEVFLVASASRKEPLIPEAVVDDEVSKQLDPLFNAFDNGYSPGQATFYQLGQLNFYWDSSNMESQSQSTFDTNWQKNVAANDPLTEAIKNAPSIDLYSAISAVFDANGNADSNLDAEQVRAQSEALAELLKTGKPSASTTNETEQSDFPTNCPVITFVLLDPVTDVIGRIGNLASAVNFNENNEVIRDQAFENALSEAAASAVVVERIELARDDDLAQEVAEARANSLKSALLAEGLAEENTVVEIQRKDAAEKETEKRIKLILR
jgi:hypothetical protein